MLKYANVLNVMPCVETNVANYLDEVHAIV